MSFIVIISYPDQPDRHVIVASAPLCNKSVEAWHNASGITEETAKRCEFDNQTWQFINRFMRTRGLRHFISKRNWLVADNAYNARWPFVERELLHTLGHVLDWNLKAVGILRIDIGSAKRLADHQRSTVLEALEQIHKVSQPEKA